MPIAQRPDVVTARAGVQPIPAFARPRAQAPMALMLPAHGRCRRRRPPTSLVRCTPPMDAAHY